MDVLEFWPEPDMARHPLAYLATTSQCDGCPIALHDDDMYQLCINYSANVSNIICVVVAAHSNT